MADTNHTVSYAELEAKSVQLARAWKRAGLRAGDHVALLSENSHYYHQVYWAAIRSGLYLTPINRHLSAEEVGYILSDCRAKSLVTTTALAQVATAALSGNDQCKHRLLIGEPSASFEHYEEFIGSESTVRLDDQPRGALMCYSSGTTGRPKGVKRPLQGKQIDDDSLAVSIDLFVDVYGMDTETRYLSPAPLYHAAPLAYTGAVQTVGGTTVLMTKFNALDALASLEKYGITHSQWVPTMFVRMLKLAANDRQRFDLSAHQCAIHAAAPCPIDVKQQMLDWWGPIIWEYYAGTEGNGATLISSAEWLTHPGSVGKPLFGELHICDDAGTQLATGQDGLVYFGLPGASFEYHGDADKTDGTRHAENPSWSSIGDIGHVDSEGYLYLTDRKAFMIISGGVNIYPREIEDCLTLHPKVEDLAVFGIPDADMGEAVHAAIQLAPEVQPDDATKHELLGYVRERIAGYKVPRSVSFVDTIPRLATGKLQKKSLRDPFWASATHRQSR